MDSNLRMWREALVQKWLTCGTCAFAARFMLVNGTQASDNIL